MAVRGEWSTRDPRSEQPQLHEALSTVGIVVVHLPQRTRQRFDEPQAAGDLGWISGAKACQRGGKLETADRGPAKAMSPLFEAVQDEIIIRESEDVVRTAAQPALPIAAALPFAFPWSSRARRKNDDGEMPSSFAPSRTVTLGSRPSPVGVRRSAVGDGRAACRRRGYSGHVIPKTMRRRFGSTLGRAELPAHFTPHCMRHTYATLLLSDGVSPVYVQQQLGHASIGVTVNRYGKWIRVAEKAADRLDDTASAALDEVVAKR